MEVILRSRFAPFCSAKKSTDSKPDGLPSVALAKDGGGYIGNNNFGFDYIKGLFTTFFGVDDISFFSAEGLDIFGNDSEKMLSEAIEKMYLVINQEKLR
jgi:FMN-dependent NADH-azoreductase